MARFRLSREAQADVAALLRTSAGRWGGEVARNYAALLAASMRAAAEHPDGPLTRDQSEIASRVRSLHLRHARQDTGAPHIGRPRHIIYYRAIGPGMIEVIAVLHERMEPRMRVRQGRAGVSP